MDRMMLRHAKTITNHPPFLMAYWRMAGWLKKKNLVLTTKNWDVIKPMLAIFGAKKHPPVPAVMNGFIGSVKDGQEKPRFDGRNQLRRSLKSIL